MPAATSASRNIMATDAGNCVLGDAFHGDNVDVAVVAVTNFI